MEQLIKRALAGDIRAIGRLISLVESEAPGAGELMKKIYPLSGKAHIIGITGSPGAGKSSFVDRLIEQFHSAAKKIAVIAVDPSSPFTGGAILGDRLRMQNHALEEGVYIRSMGSRGNLGGVSRGTQEACLILDACGYDIVIVETVGVGQSEVDIVKIADTVCLTLTPGMGDDVQIMKAGIMEIADIFIVNKADLDGAEKVASDVRLMLKFLEGREWIPPVILVSSYKNYGADEVTKSLDDHFAYLAGSEEGKRRRYTKLEMEIEAIMSSEISRVVRREWEAKKTAGALERLSCRECDPYTLTGEMISALFCEK